MPETQPDSTAHTNPYAPTTATSAQQEQLTRELIDAKENAYEPATFGMTALRWFLICFLCAAPSFLLGMAVTNGQFAGMVTGILIFVVGYTLVDYGTARQWWRRQTPIRWTLKITYGTRIAITILFPIGYVLDLSCGGYAINITETITGQGLMAGDEVAEFQLVLLTTLIQGTIMNAIVAVYGLVVLSVLGVAHLVKRQSG